MRIRLSGITVASVVAVVAVAIEKINDRLEVEPGVEVDGTEVGPTHSQRAGEHGRGPQGNGGPVAKAIEQTGGDEADDGQHHQRGPEGEALKGQHLEGASEQDARHRRGAAESE